MKFLNFATILALLASVSLGRSDDYLGTIESLPVGWGEVFHDVKVIDADEHGLTFRHQKGAAKVLYGWLPLEVEQAFAPVGPAKSAFSDRKPAGFEVTPEAPGIPPLLISVRTRVTLPTNAFGSGPVAYPWGGFPIPTWRSHWPRYHPAHALVNPYCRSWAVQDFLYSSGLVPRPTWVKGWNLEHRRPRLYYY